MEQKALIDNLNNAVRLVYLTYDYAGGGATNNPDRIKELESEIVDHCNLILKSFAKTQTPYPPEQVTTVTTVSPLNKEEDLSWLDEVGKVATDEEVASMARGG